jgi:hypothetical protein
VCIQRELLLKARRSWLNSSPSICGDMLGKAARSGKRSVQTATSSEFFDFRLLQRRAELNCPVLGHLRCGIFAISLLSAVIRCCDYFVRVRLLSSGSSFVFGHIRTPVYLTPRHAHESHLQDINGQSSQYQTATSYTR